MEHTYTATQLTLKKVEQSSYKIIISKDLERQIRFICSKISTIEWSGVLFYTHEGTFEDNNLTIIAKDLIVLDIGTGADTEFQCSNPDVVTYMIENNLLECDMGLIHSHHGMAAFFSGQDQSMLIQEGTDRNIFVSLIVNNAGNYVAGITRKITSKISEEMCYRTFGDNEICKPVEKYDAQYVEWFDLQVVKEEEEVPFPELAARLLQIAEDKKKAAETKKIVPTVIDNTPKQLSLFDDKSKSKKKSTNWDDLYDPYMSDFFYTNDKVTTSEGFLEGLEYDSGLFNDIVIKLLTGDVTANSETTTISRAAANMKLIFDRTFPTFVDFQVFAGNFIDYIIDAYGEKVIPGFEVDPKDPNKLDSQSMFAYALGSRLIEVAPNQYTEHYSDILTTNFAY